MRDIKLTDLIDVTTLQKVQDGFSEYTGMASLMTDPDGVPITRGSGFTTFCMELTRKSEKGCRLCEQCDRDGTLLTLNNKQATVYECHAGLYDYAAPIIVDGKIIGGVIGGQVRAKEVDENKFRALAEKYDIDADEYVAAVKKTKLLEYNEIERAAKFLEIIANSISEMAYRNYTALKASERLEKASKSQAEFVMNMSMNLENSVERWFDIVEKTIQNSNQREVRDLLANMQNDGFEMRKNIKNTVDYIRLSANEVEVDESIYTLGILADMVNKGIDNLREKIDIPVNFVINESLDKSFFGDVGRIGQLLNQFINTIVENKKQGKIEISIATIKKNYSTSLALNIRDVDTSLKPEEIFYMKNNFEKAESGNMVDIATEQNLTFEALLVHSLNASIIVNQLEKDLEINIIIPQLAV